jgi:hypothetical protein
MSAEQIPAHAPILGLLKGVRDPNNGAVAHFHVVSGCQIGFLYGSSASVTFAGYFSRETHDAGLQPMLHVALQLKRAPSGDSAAWPAWFIAQVLANEVELMPGQAEHPLAGAQIVRAGEAAA